MGRWDRQWPWLFDRGRIGIGLRGPRLQGYPAPLFSGSRSPVKVVHVITRLDFGGAQQNTLYTVSHLDPSSYEVVLVAGSGGKLDGMAMELSQGRQVLNK